MACEFLRVFEHYRFRFKNNWILFQSNHLVNVFFGYSLFQLWEQCSQNTYLVEIYTIHFCLMYTCLWLSSPKKSFLDRIDLYIFFCLTILTVQSLDSKRMDNQLILILKMHVTFRYVKALTVLAYYVNFMQFSHV